MESPDSFVLKAEPASPIWELELLDEVEGLWEGHLGDVDVEDDEEFWQEQDISELIGKEEQILGLELDEIILEGDIDVKEEPPYSWLDNGAIYDGPSAGLPSYSPQGLWVAPESPTDEKPTFVAAESTVQLQSSSADLLRDLPFEFDTVFRQTAGSLTPPDSPRSGTGGLLALPPDNLQQLSPATGQEYILLQEISGAGAESNELDELIETYQKAEETGSVADKSGKNASDRPWDSPSATSSGSSDSGYDDPDWTSVNSVKSTPASDNSPPTKKPRLTTTEERRLRKKEQNKNAATRYRIKKKMEMEEIVGEEKELMDRNDSLKSEVVEITREIKYLKSLMGDLFRAKGLLKPK